MSVYQDQPMSFGKLCFAAIRHHIKVLPKIIALILLILVVKDAYIYLGGMPHNTVLKIIVTILIWLLLIYFWSVSLYSTKAVLEGQPLTLNDTCRFIYRRILPIYLCCILYFLGFLCIVGIAKLIVLIASQFLGHNPVWSRIGFVLIGGIIFVYSIVLAFFALPLVALGQNRVLLAFRDSLNYVKDEWFYVFGIYIVLMAFILLLSPNTLHSLFLQRHHLVVVFDFIVLCLFLPFLNNLILLTLHQLRHSET